MVVAEQLKKLENYLSDLYNYTLSDIKLKETAAAVNRILGDNFFDKGAFLIRKEINPDLGKIREAKEYLDQLLGVVRNSTTYLALLDSYKNNNQESLKELAPRVFSNLTICNSLSSEELYHGIAVRRDLNVSTYVDLASRIIQIGIFPSPHGQHHSMDENIRPIYNVIEPEETHGILFFAFEPIVHGCAVFNPNFEAERLIYSPLLKVPMKLFLKSKQYLKLGLRMEGYDPADKEKFRDEVENKLRRMNIDFKLNEPTGF